ncbi:MAG TPA: DNA-directed RNA polymerase subunit H [Candidatus Nanoarchaeia archaeon]|nr:DNA-directed RNA polymerase subunit H [Candidatus Nanoarchaeia archaeon]
MTTIKKKTVEKHELIPIHEKISDSEKQTLFSEKGISFKDLPKINRNDPAVVDMEVKIGDVIKITRASSTAKETVFYRGVIDA